MRVYLIVFLSFPTQLKILDTQNGLLNAFRHSAVLVGLLSTILSCLVTKISPTSAHPYILYAHFLSSSGLALSLRSVALSFPPICPLLPTFSALHSLSLSPSLSYPSNYHPTYTLCYQPYSLSRLPLLFPITTLFSPFPWSNSPLPLTRFPPPPLFFTVLIKPRPDSPCHSIVAILSLLTPVYCMLMTPPLTQLNPHDYLGYTCRALQTLNDVI